MQQFEIRLNSFRQIQDFVALCLKQEFDISAGNDYQNINAKDLLGMFSLDYTFPIVVRANCSNEEFWAFQQEAEQFHTAAK